MTAQPIFIVLLLFAAIAVTSVRAACNFDKYNPEHNKTDPCNDIKHDKKKEYKKEHHYLKLHVRMCQVCEYSCDVTKKDFGKEYFENMTTACTGEKGCSKRFISWKGCPYDTPSKFYGEPKCFFDPDEKLFYVEDKCEATGSDKDEDKQEDEEKDPVDKWDPAHKYKVFHWLSKQQYRKAGTQAWFLFKNAFLDVCRMPNTYNLLDGVVGAFVCILRKCSKRYIGFRLCPADSDHITPFALDIDVPSAGALQNMLNGMMTIFRRCLNNGGVCPGTEKDPVNITDYANQAGLNKTEYDMPKVWNMLYCERNCTAWDKDQTGLPMLPLPNCTYSKNKTLTILT